MNKLCVVVSKRYFNSTFAYRLAYFIGNLYNYILAPVHLIYTHEDLYPDTFKNILQSSDTEGADVLFLDGAVPEGVDFLDTSIEKVSYFEYNEKVIGVFFSAEALEVIRQGYDKAFPAIRSLEDLYDKNMNFMVVNLLPYGIHSAK